MEGIDIWRKFLEKCSFFFMNSETISEFQERMQAAGFSLSWQDPQTDFGIENVIKNLLSPPGPAFQAHKVDLSFVNNVIVYLNQTAGTAFRIKVPSANATTILARRHDGYTMENFKTVIDKKTAEWKGTTMERHLNPGTLFSRKHFDNYLGQKTDHAQPAGQKTSYQQLNESLDKAKGRL